MVLGTGSGVSGRAAGGSRGGNLGNRTNVSAVAAALLAAAGLDTPRDAGSSESDVAAVSGNCDDASGAVDTALSNGESSEGPSSRPHSAASSGKRVKRSKKKRRKSGGATTASMESGDNGDGDGDEDTHSAVSSGAAPSPLSWREIADLRAIQESTVRLNAFISVTLIVFTALILV